MVYISLFVIYLLTIVLYALLRLTAFQYTFDIFKLFLISWSENVYFCIVYLYLFCHWRREGFVIIFIFVWPLKKGRVCDYIYNCLATEGKGLWLYLYLFGHWREGFVIIFIFVWPLKGRVCDYIYIVYLFGHWRREGFVIINWYNTTTFLCLSNRRNVNVLGLL